MSEKMVPKGKYISLEEAVKIMHDPHMDMQDVRVPDNIQGLLEIMNEALQQIMDNGEQKLRELEAVDVYDLSWDPEVTE